MALYTTCTDTDSGKEGGNGGSNLCSECLPWPLPGPVPGSSQAQPDDIFLCHVVAVEWLIEKCSETQGLVQRGHQRLTAVRVENYEKNMRRLPVLALWCSKGFVSVGLLPVHYRVRFAKRRSVNLGMLAAPSQLADRTFFRLIVSYP